MRALFVLFLIGLLSCGDDGFRKVEKLDGFRILGIKASQPEVNPGANSTLEVYVSDPNGPPTGRVINGVTEACIDPGVSAGAEVNCSHDPARITGTYTIDTTAPDLLNNLFTGHSGSLTVTVPPTILAGRSSRDQTNGVAYIVIFTFIVDGQEFKSFKRIIATTRTPLNTNPSGTTIWLNNALFTGNPKKGDKLKLTTSAPETFTYVSVDGTLETRTEELDVAWYVTDAEFDRPKANLEEEAELIKEPPSGPYLVIGIVRDDRGGMEVVRMKVP